MYKKKDFIFMDVFNNKGKKIGYINDILIDCHKEKVIGFNIIPKRFFKKNMSVLKEDIVYYNNTMVIRKIARYKSLGFSEINNMDVIDNKGNVIGIVEDIIFDEYTFQIHAIIVSVGFLKRFTEGKKIILLKDILFGERNLLNFNCSNMINFYCKLKISI